MISFDSLKPKGSAQSWKDKPRVLPTPPVSGAPPSIRSTVATDPEASLLFHQSRPTVTTASAPSADDQDLMSFESIVPRTTQTFLTHPTHPRVLPVPPLQSTTRSVSPAPSADPAGSVVNQPLLLDALSYTSKEQSRQDWVQFTVSCSCGSPSEALVTQVPLVVFCLTATIVSSTMAARWGWKSTTSCLCILK